MAEHVLPDCHPLSHKSRKRGYEKGLAYKKAISATPYPRDDEGLTPLQGLMVALLSLGIDRAKACKMAGVTIHALHGWSRSPAFKQAVARRSNEFQATVTGGLKSAVIQVIAHLQRLLATAHKLDVKEQLNLMKLVLDSAGFKGAQNITNVQVNNYENMSLEQLKSEIDKLKHEVIVDTGFEVQNEPDPGKDPPA